MISISAISCVSETLRPIFDLGDDRSVLEILHRDGFEFFFSAQTDVVGLAAKAIEGCLHQSGQDPLAIDAVIFSTESFSTPARSEPSNIGVRDNFLVHVYQELGLKNADVYGSWLLGCGNFISSLALAKALLESGAKNNILVVLSDRARGSELRIPNAGTCVFSDGAVAFLVCARAVGFQIEKLIQHIDGAIAFAKHQKNFLAHGLSLAKASTDFARKLEKASGKKIQDYPVIITDNFHHFSVRYLSDCLGIEVSRFAMPTKKTGHMFSCDCPRSLSHIYPGLNVGDSLAVLNVGPFGLGFLSLKVAG